MRAGKAILGDKFDGVYNEHSLPNIAPNHGIIVNKPTNEHWIAMANVHGNIHTYDSYGRRAINGEPLDKPLKIGPKIKQTGTQQNCGARSLTALYMLLNPTS